jgi:hypothetical protein
VLDAAAHERRFSKNVERAARWALANHGKSAPRSPEVGHDSTLVGWSWAAATHSWLEPTCYFVLGLAEAGYSQHPRRREGLRLIADRLLPAGGANYGNTIVLGQPLLPHIQPSGLAMLALAGREDADGRIARSLDYLEHAIGPHTAAASLALACLGLAAHGRRPRQADELILAAIRREQGRRPAAAFEQALLLLAARRDIGWLTSTSGAPSVAAEGAAR